uniref:Putative intergrin alpha chain protein n=1 Tax=Trypanosoma congolense (strain IL3000) TaxID=1068625 RepID=G0UQR1_TRYCI|nr:putative intergrin alpha chain protein [Trypanosoma congolense IL3000]
MKVDVLLDVFVGTCIRDVSRINIIVAILSGFVFFFPATATGATVQWEGIPAYKPPRHVTLHEDLMSHEEKATPRDGSDAVHMCRTGVHLEWTTHVGSSALATPRVVDLNHDGNKEILVPTYSQYLEAIDGARGGDVAGFPFAHPRFKTYASPVPVDVIGDGTTKWLVAMYTGELMVFSEDGDAQGAAMVPPLPVKRDWARHKLGKDSAVNTTLTEKINMNTWLHQMLRQRRIEDLSFWRQRPNNNSVAEMRKREIINSEAVRKGDEIIAKGSITAEEGVIHKNAHDKVEDEDPETFDFIDSNGNRMEVPFSDADASHKEGLQGSRSIGTDGRLSPEARASMDLLYHPELYKSSFNHEESDPFSYHNILSPFNVSVSDDDVVVDPHIMSTPTIADVDGNSNVDVVVHVSYFFDLRDYDTSERDERFFEGVNFDEYVADVLVSIDLVSGELKWLKVLHLTTQSDRTPAFALSSPVIGGSDKMGKRDVFVTTTAGAIFGFKGDGRPMKGWPVWMNSSMTASPSLEDVDNDGVIDVCAGDALGYVACFTNDGKQIWSKRFSGAMGDHITFGDVDGDGKIDMTFGTAAGLIYAVRGHDGTILPHFPIATGGSILASPLLVNLNATSGEEYDEVDSRGLHVVVPSHDGVLYIASGTSGCIDAIDIDEKSSAMVLADDITGNGMLDLVVSTLSGSIMVFETSAKFHPLKAWPSRVKSLNGFTASEGRVGVFIHPSSRVPRDIRGETFALLVSIHDKRTGPGVARVYDIVITIGPRILVHRNVYTAPGTYAITMHAPLERMYGIVSVVMTLPNGQQYEDTLALSFNMHFLEGVKYTFIIPFFFACLVISFVRKQHEVGPRSI